jgi:hypothetical protein
MQESFVEKTAAEKMQIKPGRKVRLVNAPESASVALWGNQAAVPAQDLLDGPAAQGALADIIVLFAHHRADLERLLPDVPAALAPGGFAWVAYHKGTSPVKTDINRDSIWRYAQTLQMDAVSQISIDDDWSALRLKLRG